MLLGRRRRERELDEEIRAHISMAVEERVARGESREAAERAVRREFGNEARVREVTRTMWGGMWLDRLAQDVRYGLRSLRRDPGFTSVAVLTLGLGIGATTAMFTVVHGTLVSPLPYAEPERLVDVAAAPAERPNSVGLLDRHFVELREDPGPFSSMAAHSFFPPVTLTGAGDPVRLEAAYVTAEIHSVLGVRPALGPGFSAGDDDAGAPPVVLLGDALWRERFDADPEVIGRSVVLDGSSVNVAGVMPPGFAFPRSADLWLPLQITLDSHGSFSYSVVARLGEGVSPEEARALLAARLGELDRAELQASVTPLKDVVVGASRYPILLLTGAVALVLLIACTNVANLLLMRAGTRDREMGIRMAVGAGGARLVRQLLTESSILAALGGVGGALLAVVGVDALLALAPPGTIPRSHEIGVDLSALAFALVVAGLTGITFGLAPAIRTARKRPREAVTYGARTHTRGGGAARSVLVVAEVSLAVVLLTGAGLLVRSFQELRSIDLGFEPNRTITFELDLPRETYETFESMLALHLETLEGLRAIPGVTAAGAANFEPLGAFASNGTYTADAPAEGVPATCERCAGMSIASAGYFSAMGIPILDGRELTAAEDQAAARVVVLGRSTAQRFWPGESAVGRRIQTGRRPGPGQWLTVVGVVEDVIRSDITESRGPMVYLPVHEIEDPFYVGHARYVIRTPLPRESVVPAIRQVLLDVDPMLATGPMSTMDDVVVASIGDRLFETRILATFAALALLLAAVGIFGVTAFSVSERTREIGIRRALGAEAPEVRSLVLRRVVMLVLPGLALGGVGGATVSGLLESSLYGVERGDPVTLLSVGLLLVCVSIAAASVPLRRATRVSPIVVLSE
jgi:predicted permease